MANSPARTQSRRIGAVCTPVDLSGLFNWPKRVPKDAWWHEVVQRVRAYPRGDQTSWGVPLKLAKGAGARVIMVSRETSPVEIPVNAKADYLCLLHAWEQTPESVDRDTPAEGILVGRYTIRYADGKAHVQPIRGRYEVDIPVNPGPPWLACPFSEPIPIDPIQHPADTPWGNAQTGLARCYRGAPFLYPLRNPHARKRVRALVVEGLVAGPLLIAALTVYQGRAHPLRHLARRLYRVHRKGKPVPVTHADVDMGGVVRVEHTDGPRNRDWLESNRVGINVYGGISPGEAVRGGEDLIEAYGAEDATLRVDTPGRKSPIAFPLGDAFRRGRTRAQRGDAVLEVLGRQRTWLTVTLRDTSTGKPTPARIHFSGSRGEYIAPYGHHAQVNPRWFEDYGADLQWGGMNYAYMPGQFATDLPVGDVYVEIDKGFEYAPVRRKVTIRPGQKTLELRVGRWADWRKQGWVTADTHVHFLSPQTAWLEAQAEGVNVVNLLASQWGRLFTNVGDISGRVGVVEDDTIVWVGTENRNHMLGHISMLGTQGLPVFPMCCGGPGEAALGDPDFRTLAEWAIECKRKDGVVIRPHYPYCGNTEDPVFIIQGLVDALEIRGLRGEDFPTQEWYRYLNNGYRVAVAGGTDKMGAYCALGSLRTYALLDANRPFTYESWARAMRAGRCVATTGPMMDLTVEGKSIGETIRLPASGGTLEVDAVAESYWPVGRLEVVHNGAVVASTERRRGARRLRVHTRVRVSGSGWVAARCQGAPEHPARGIAAHTSPVYVTCGRKRAFDGPALEHMLQLVSGGIEYLETLSTRFDEREQKRMVDVYKDARHELWRRLNRGQ